MTVAARDAARVLAGARVAAGGAMLVAPGVAGRLWIGADAERPAVKVFCRALGIRDLLLGALALHTMGHPQVGSRSMLTCAVADAVDFGATLAAGDHLPPRKRAAALAVAGGSAVAGVALATALRS